LKVFHHPRTRACLVVESSFSRTSVSVVDGGLAPLAVLDAAQPAGGAFERDLDVFHALAEAVADLSQFGAEGS
jgi:hypothetical protein